MKGTISLQFNWIFIIIVGAAFLALFVIQSNNAANISRYENSLLLKQTLQSNIASGKLNKLENISLGFVQINNECLDEKTTLYFSKNLLPIETSYYVLHAPKRINAHKLFLQIIDGNSLLTADDHVYVFVKTNDLNTSIVPYYQAFGGNKILLNQLTDAYDYLPTDSSLKYTLIFKDININNNQIAYNSQAKSKPDIVIISQSNNENKLTFYDMFTQNPPPENFLSLGEAIGGIVDSDPTLYSCNHKNQMMKQYRKLLLLDKKIINITASNQVTDFCIDLLNYAKVYVNQAKELIVNDGGVYQTGNEAELLTKLANINEVNTDLARNNCPLIQ